MKAKVKLNLTMPLTTFPLPVQKSPIEWKIHLFATLFKGIKAFSCLFYKKRGIRIVAALWDSFCFLKDKMGADKRLTEILSACPDLINLRLGEDCRETCFCCLSGCTAAKDTYPFYFLFFIFLILLLSFFLACLLSFLFLLFPLFFSLSLLFSFFPTLFPKRNQKEMDAASREQCREGTGYERGMIQVSRVPGLGPGCRGWHTQPQTHLACFSHCWGAKWWCGDVVQWWSPNMSQRWACSCQPPCLLHNTWKIMDQGKELRQGTICFLNFSVSWAWMKALFFFHVVFQVTFDHSWSSNLLVFSWQVQKFILLQRHL